MKPEYAPSVKKWITTGVPHAAATTLDQLPVHTVATIQAIKHGTHEGDLLKRRLMELGFVPGERVQVLRRIFAGSGPLAVRVGTSTFAMRKLESSLIEVVPA